MKKKPLEFEQGSTIRSIKNEDGDRETDKLIYGEYNIRNLGVYFV
jgi:hypothetical protein